MAVWNAMVLRRLDMEAGRDMEDQGPVGMAPRAASIDPSADFRRHLRRWSAAHGQIGVSWFQVPIDSVELLLSMALGPAFVGWLDPRGINF